MEPFVAIGHHPVTEPARAEQDDHHGEDARAELTVHVSSLDWLAEEQQVYLGTWRDVAGDIVELVVGDVAVVVPLE